MPTVALTTVAGWVWDLLINIMGDPVLAGITGYILLLIIGIRMGLGFDGLIVLGIFSGTLIGGTTLIGLDLGLLAIIAVSISVVSLAVLRLMRH